LIYHTQLTVNGPWLIDSKALKELGEIIDRSWLRFEKLKEDAIKSQVAGEINGRSYKDPEDRKTDEAEIEERIRRYYGAHGKSITLSLKDNKSYRAESIQAALTEADLLSEESNGLAIELRNDQLQAMVDVDKLDLRIRTSPPTDAFAREIFVTLREWAEKNKAPLWQRLWRYVVPFHWVAWLLILSFSGLIHSASRLSAGSQRGGEAVKLLEGGLAEEELNKAIELLLRSEFGIVTSSNSDSLPSWFFAIICIGFVVAMILSFRPKLAIGIGKGNTKIAIWRRWLRFISITVPGLVFAGFLWPHIVKLIKGFFA